MMQLSRSITVLLIAALLALLPSIACGQSQPAEPGAAGVLDDTSWYDADTGNIIPVHVKEVTDDSLNRQSRWLPKAKKIPKKPTTANTATGGGPGGGLFGTDLTLGNLFGWLLLALIVCLAVGTLVYAFSKSEIDLGSDSKSKTDADQAKTPDAQTIERMKHLPAELRRTDVNLRSEAERLMNEGHFDQAIILLFGHQLLLLDQAGCLRLSRGKTNGRYVRETRAADGESADRLRLTATAFERSYFGRHAISTQEFSALWHNNALLQQRLSQRAEVAA